MRTPALALFCVALSALFGGGCVSDTGKSERSASIVATGDASIENWVVKSISTTRIYVLRINGQLVQARGKRGVYALSPGVHNVDVNCEFSRMTIGDLYIDAGTHTFRLEAKAGTRYRVKGDKISNEQAELWIEEFATGRVVAERVKVPLFNNPQNVQLPIVIPVPVR